MANLITAGEAYDPFFYANQALRQLNKVLGMARLVFRGFDRTPTDRGSVIKLRRPGKFTAQVMPIALASATDVTPEYLQVTLDQWFGTMFRLTDLELTYTREQMVNEHLGPAAIGVADKIDQSLIELQDDVGYFHVRNATTPFEDFPDVRKILFDNLNPGSPRRFGVGAALQNLYEKDSIFVQANTSSDSGELQQEGLLVRKFGFDIFANQNFLGHTQGNMAATAGALTNGAQIIGATTVPIDDATALTGTINKGDSVTFAGDTTRYAITANTAAAGNAATLPISPALQAALADGVAVTFRQVVSTERGVAFHPEAFALAMVPLSSMGDGAGARIGTAVDPISGLALRSTIFYDPGTAQNYVRIDALWGRKTIDPQLAVNVELP